MTTDVSMPDIILRAAVSDRCNYSCVYCPRKEDGTPIMENGDPRYLGHKDLSTKEYIPVLKEIQEYFQIKTVSFTGGEPTLNPELKEISEIAHKIFETVEITTNGSTFDSMKIIGYLSKMNLVKVSLTPYLTHTGNNEHTSFHTPQSITEAIRKLQKNGVNVSFNLIVMKSNLSQIKDIIRFSRKLDVPLHLLDLVFYPSNRSFWEEQFIPLDSMKGTFEKIYGKPELIKRYGCTFFGFDTDDIYTRFKDSKSATTRSIYCDTCEEYCQEGPYGLKLSTTGWITACPSINKEKGTYILTNPKIKNLESKSFELHQMFRNTRKDSKSFYKFLQHWQLNPKNMTLSSSHIMQLLNNSQSKSGGN
ncbi:7,8-dihydro-6-hydroxymethylpterin dimethyltransferase [ANME-1 cluster archaeon GoMg2]|nr:7,8-dihydro-6-hydroxymethylpterin dimethyltransferase [ANME-1 cluster archaeon GoMg2]